MSWRPDDSILVEGSGSRRELLERFGGASDGRREALLRDPSLAAVGVEDGDFDDADVEEIKRSVQAARRVRGIEGAAEHRISHRFSGLAAGLAGLLLLLAPPAGVERVAAPLRALSSPGAMFETATITHPAVEAIDLPEARIYELADEGFSVVLIVDDSFDL